MPKQSAGILLYRIRNGQPEVLLVHPGGPFWTKKNLGAWTIPKGEIAEGEDPLTTAIREFREETGFALSGDFRPLPSVRQAGGKVIEAWALEGDCDAGAIQSNTFEMEWPPRSGRMAAFLEVDRGEWFSLEEAARRINPAQSVWLNELERLL